MSIWPPWSTCRASRVRSSPRRRGPSLPIRVASSRPRPLSRRGSPTRGVAATAKHFPGSGPCCGEHRCCGGHDRCVVGAARCRSLAVPQPDRCWRAARDGLERDLHRSGRQACGLVAGGSGLLRRTLGFAGVTITDALDAVAVTHRRSVASAALSRRRPASICCSSRAARPRARRSTGGSSRRPRQGRFPGRHSRAEPGEDRRPEESVSPAGEGDQSMTPPPPRALKIAGDERAAELGRARRP